jgi:hypothetical protein
VCATQNQGIDAALLETAQISLDGHFHHVVVGPSLLHQRHEEGTGTTIDLDPSIRFFQRPRVSAALDGYLGADNANLITLCTLDRPAYARLDNSDYRNRKGYLSAASGQ